MQCEGTVGKIGKVLLAGQLAEAEVPVQVERRGRYDNRHVYAQTLSFNRYVSVRSEKEERARAHQLSEEPN